MRSRAVALWTRPGAPGVMTPEVLASHEPKIRVHRRVLTGYAAGRLAPVTWAPNIYRGVRSALSSRKGQVLAELEKSFEAYTGVPVATQRKRAAVLARRGIPRIPAYRFGLLRDGWKGRWAEFVFDDEIGWNVAAGGLPSSQGIRLLGDKAATQQLLAAVGVPVVDHRLVRRRSAVAHDTLRNWLGDLDAVFAKPVSGSQGRGAFLLHADPLTVSLYPAVAEVENPARYVQERVDESDYLIQPLLRTHRALADLAGTADVVTLRIVTRDLGDGPHVFSAVAEIPLTQDGEKLFYALLVVGADGTIGPPARPPWYPVPEGEGEDVARRAAGRPLPGFESLVEGALTAHRAFPGVFAIAWDVAVTDEGPVFLEGNGGFGTLIPQVVAGGLLVGLS